MLVRLPGQRNRGVLFQTCDGARHIISWRTLEQQFAYNIHSEDDAAVVFDLHAAAIERAAEVAQLHGDRVLDVEHFAEVTTLQATR